MRLAAAAAVVALLGSACGEADPARAAFDETVIPVLQRSCGASTCHGVAPGAEARGEVVDWSRFHYRLDAAGAPADPDRLYEVARRYIDTAEDPAFSSLLRKPLDVRLGGLPHYGGVSWSGPGHPDYAALYRWILLESEGGEDPEPLDEMERLFAETVQPVLRAGTCFTPSCHGPTAGAIPYALDPGYGGEFPIAATRKNHQESLRQLSLDGFPALSRLVRKSRPISEGGIAHKGMNFDFYAGDPGDGVDAIAEWACAERLARTGRPCAQAGDAPITGFVFVQGPLESGHTFDLDVFRPGQDVYLATVADGDLEPASVRNLTASLHREPADIRDPAVSPGGDSLLFAMRTHAGEGHHLYLMDLATGAARPLTSGNGPLLGGGMATDRDPTFGPDGSVWFVSTRAGVLDDSGRHLDADLYSLDVDTGEVRRWTWTPHSERKPDFYRIGPSAGEVAVSALREALPAQGRAHPFRFPPDLETEYHQHFGITPDEDLLFDMREMPDGRYVATVGDREGVWSAGGLGIVDRNFGPELDADSGDAPALPSYLPPLVALDPDASSSGWTGGAWRDTAPLPDGRLLAAYAPQAFDLADPDAEPVFRIELLTLEEALDGSGPVLADRRVLVEVPGVSVFDPEPVYVRAPAEARPSHEAEPGEDRGLFLHGGLPMIDALLTNLSPSGVKEVRDDIRAVRVVEGLPTRPVDRVPVPPEETRHGIPGATSTGLGAFTPARVLGELPLAADGTFQVDLPAGIPFRLQALDGAGMAVGTMHNRWYDLAPGQTVRQGVSAWTGSSRYETQCGACHGNADGGDGPPALEAPDAMTSASITLSRFADQDPRRPLAPPELGEATRIEVDFEEDVQPLLAARCEGCHGGAAPAAGLSLTGEPTPWYTDAYESLLAPGAGSAGGFAYVDAATGSARGSFLVEKLAGAELDAPRGLDAAGEPHPREHGGQALTAEELGLLVRWIDLGAGYRVPE
ncbi:hypothetical protein L6R50_25225 [Myxococcota bacterium]|nr:hypothetical protein [Myxococcota bacterium]